MFLKKHCVNKTLRSLTNVKVKYVEVCPITSINSERMLRLFDNKVGMESNFWPHATIIIHIPIITEQAHGDECAIGNCRKKWY